jgi:hypothetical protein
MSNLIVRAFYKTKCDKNIGNQLGVDDIKIMSSFSGS